MHGHRERTAFVRVGVSDLLLLLLSECTQPGVVASRSDSRGGTPAGGGSTGLCGA